MDKTLRLRVILEGMCPADEPGFENIEGRLSSKKDGGVPPRKIGNDLVFECEVRVRRNPKSGSPNFLGKHALGPVAERHLGVGWGYPQRDGSFRVKRGVKIFLTSVKRANWERPGITWNQIEADGVVETRLAATSEDGTPVCAGVPNDWLLKER